MDLFDTVLEGHSLDYLGEVVWSVELTPFLPGDQHLLALRGLKEWEQPEVLNTDRAPAYAAAIADLKAEGKCPKDTRHRQVKYLNNVIEADHGKLKLLIRPVRGFKTLKTAYATIKGFEVMRALRKGQAGMFALQGGIVGEARIVERAFDLGPCALTEAVALLQDRLANAET